MSNGEMEEIEQAVGNLHPAGEALSNAIWEAAWFAVDKHYSKVEFVAMVTKAANEAFDSQVNNAAVAQAD
jgi:hypothetical protein